MNIIMSSKTKTRAAESKNDSLTKLETNMSGMYYRYGRWQSTKKVKKKSDLGHFLDFYFQWCEHSLKYFDNERITGVEQNFSNRDVGQCKSQYEFFNSQNPYDGLTMNWNIRLDPGLIRRLRSSKPSLKTTTMSAVLEVAKGNFQNMTLHKIGPLNYMATFFCHVERNSILVFCLLPERYPVVKNNIVEAYKYIQYIRFIDILSSESQVNKLLEKFIKKIVTHPDKFVCFEHGEHKDQLPKGAEPEMGDRKWTSLGDIVTIRDNTSYGMTLYLPKIVESKIALTKAESLDIVYNPEKKYWENKALLETKSKEANYLEKLLAVKKSLVKALERGEQEGTQRSGKCSKLQLKLTEEEKNLIGEPGNILAIGRSGTGKTTCALLRLFATEILFKVRSGYANKAILKDTRFSADDVDSTCGLHTIFVTASPVLTNEVRRYYERLNEKIKSELVKRDQKRDVAKKDAAKKEEENAPEVVNISEIEEIKVPEKSKEAKEAKEAKEEDKVEKGEVNMTRMEEIEDLNEELNMMDENELEKQLSLAHTLNAISDEQFPLFLTIRRLLLMVDGTLKRPFFSRNPKGEVIGLEGNAEWHNETRGVMMINSMHKYDEKDIQLSAAAEKEDPNKILDQLEKEEDDDEYCDIGGFEEEEERKAELARKKQLKKQARKTHYMAREVNFDAFVKKFWPTIHGKVQASTQMESQKINPASIWREIHTHIKGSVEAHEFAAHHIPTYRYEQIVKGVTIFSPATYPKVFEIFYRYERWCYENNYYDMSDIVNHILSQIRWNGYHGQPIHFIMCDEVQDLPPATLLLLLKLAEQNLFFSGDTAQTIAQGISFRFADLKSLFYTANLHSGMPSIMQLTINFRSHARILDLANSIIRALELFFPSSIDKLRKEKSPYDGVMPIVLDSEMQESLFNLLLGSQPPSGKSSDGLLTRPPLEFGCDQVIIVRNQKAKANLPRFLKHALCLTIYEAKGLEFDDVILYNFFTDSEVKEEWKVLKALTVDDVKVPKEFSEGSSKQTFDQLTVQSDQLPEEYKQLKEGEYRIIKNVSAKARSETLEGKYSALTTELKHLYTAITRPRKRLIIFDENPIARKPMLDYWLSLGYIKVITKEELDATVDPKAESPSADSKQILESLTGKNTSKLGWRAQGIRMFRRKYYEQAMKCFENSEDTELKIRAEGYFQATRGSELLAEIETLKYSLTLEGETKEEKTIMKEKISGLVLQVDESFKQAATIFEHLNMKMQAGQCYFSVQNYAKAAECFEVSGLFGQAGEAYFKMGEFVKAGQLYEKGGVPSNAIISYENAKDWELVLKCIHNFKDKLAYDHRMKLVKKYIQLALQAAFQEYESAQEEANANNKPKKEIAPVEEKLDELISSSAEKSDLSVMKSTEEEKKEEAPKLDSAALFKIDQSTVPEEKKETKADKDASVELVDNKSEKSGYNPFEEVNVSKESDSNNPFEVLSAASGKSKTSKKSEKVVEEDKSEFSLGESNSSEKRKAIDIDHIAGLDPDDEWIQCETGSIIDSVVSGKVSASNKESDYSIIDNAHAFAVNCSLVRTKRDIFVEDQTMAKVIRYISYFSEEVHNFLDGLRSKSVLLHKKEVEGNAAKSTADFIVDLDEIDLNFVNLLLDILENLGLYKLCIVICNRYQINGRIGRYLVSIGHRYSNIKLICDSYEKYAAAGTETYREMQVNNSIIANTAIHSVFEVINPVYLRLKKYMEMIDEKNSLGTYCYRSMVILGYWKKLVYVMDCESSLSLTSMFADYYNFKMLYLMNFGSVTKKNAVEIQARAKSCTFEWLPFKEPSNPIEKRALIVALDSVINDLNRIHGYTYVRAKSEIIPIRSAPEFPTLMPCNAALWKFVFDSSETTCAQLEKQLDISSKEFLNFDKVIDIPLQKEVLVWDFCVALVQLMFGFRKNDKIREFITRINGHTYNTLLQCIFKIISIVGFGRTNKVYCDLYYTVYLATLSSFGLRRTEGRDCRIGYGRNFILQRSSIYFTIAAQLAAAKKLERKKELEEKITKEMPKYYMNMTKQEFSEFMQEKLREAMEAEHNLLTNSAETYFADLETEYVFISPELLTGKICEDIAHITEDMTLERLDSEDRKKKKSIIISEIWSLGSEAEVKDETYRVALKIGEISHTLRTLGLFIPQALSILQSKRKKIDIIEYYFNTIKKREEDEEFGKFNKKKKKKNNVAEEWVLDTIHGAICGLFIQLPDGVENTLFPTLCSYLAIDKYILFVEQLRSLHKTCRRISDLQTSWLDALAEYKTNCLDDCFGHMIQYFDDNRKELDIYSKVAIAEKIVTLALILTRGIAVKGEKGPSFLLLPTNTIKHFNFAKLSGKEHEYKIEIFKHNQGDANEENEIMAAAKDILEKALTDTSYCYTLNGKRFAYEVLQVLVLAMYLNTKTKSQVLELAPLVKLISNEGQLKFSILQTAYPDEWKTFQNVFRKNPDVLQFFKILEKEWLFRFKIEYVEVVHNNAMEPNLSLLEKDGLHEASQMATHVSIYKKLRNKKLSREMVKMLKHSFSQEKYDITLEARAYGHNVTPEIATRFWTNKSSGYYLQLMENTKDTHMVVLNTFYRTPIFNVLDAHYLFTLLEQVDEYYVRAVHIAGGAMEGKEEEKGAISSKEIRENTEKLRAELKIWKNNKFMPDEEYIEKKKIVYKIKWQQHKKKQYQQMMAKKAGLKRQEALRKKADAIKGKGQDLFSYATNI